MSSTPLHRRRPGAVAAALLAGSLAVPASAQRASTAAVDPLPQSTAYRSTPCFVPNQGGWDPQVAFAMLRGPTPAWIERDGFRLLGRTGGGHSDAEGTGTVLRFVFEGGAARSVRGEGPAEGVVRRIGAGARVGGGKSFGAVRFEEVWPGIDVVVRPDPLAGAAGALAYDLHLAPGADLSAAVLRVEGADRMNLDVEGALEIVGVSEVGSTAPRLLQRAPVSWSWAEDGSREPVAVRFCPLGGGRFGFRCEESLGDRALVVDPGFTWVGYLGGGTSDQIDAVAVREDGIWVTGFAGSSNFPVTPGAWRETGRRDAFVSRLSPDGTTLIWSTYFGGSNADAGRAIDVAPDGSVWFGGYTSSLDLPVTADATQPTFGGASLLLQIGDAFLARLSADGSELLHATYLGGSGDEFLEMVCARDPEVGITVAGYTDSDDLPSTAGAVQPVFGSGSVLVPDAFVARFGRQATQIDWLTYFGGDAMDYVSDAEVAPDGSVWLCGWTGSVDYRTTPDAARRVVGGLWDGYVARISADGTELLASTLLGGDGPDQARGLAVDPASGDCFVVGLSLAEVESFDLGLDGWQPEAQGDSEGFVVRVARDGTSLRAASRFGGDLADQPLDAAVLDDGSVVVVGTTEGGALPTGVAAPQPDYGGGVQDGFVARFDPWLRQSPTRTFLGGSEGDRLVAVVPVPGSREVVAVGSTDSAGLATDNGVFQDRLRFGGDGLMARIDVGGASDGALELRAVGADLGIDGVAFQPGDHLDLALRIDNDSGRDLRLDGLEIRVAVLGGFAGAVRTLSVIEDQDGDGRAGPGEPFLAGPLPIDAATVRAELGGRILASATQLALVVSLQTDPTCPAGCEVLMAVSDSTALIARDPLDGRGVTVLTPEAADPSTAALQSPVWVAGERLALDLDQDSDQLLTVFDVRRLAQRQARAASPREDIDGDGSVTAVEIGAALDLILERPAAALDDRIVTAGGVLSVRGYALQRLGAMHLGGVGGRRLAPLGGGDRLQAFAVPRDLAPGVYDVGLAPVGGTPRVLGQVEIR